MKKFTFVIFSVLVLLIVLSCGGPENGMQNIEVPDSGAPDSGVPGNGVSENVGPPSEVAHNTLTEEETAEGWELLFDGESTDGWRGYNSETFPEAAWTVENGELIVLSSGDRGEGSGGDIITEEKFTNFILELEWNVSERGNSGVFYSVLEQPGEPIFWSAPEVQILDDALYDLEDVHLSGGLYDLIAADPLNAGPAGEWNEVRVVVDHPRVEHWQNGVKVVEYERWNAEWYAMLRESKFACRPEFGAVRTGPIGLQDHGDQVRFRNIKIRRLD